MKTLITATLTATLALFPAAFATAQDDPQNVEEMGQAAPEESEINENLDPAAAAAGLAHTDFDAVLNAMNNVGPETTELMGLGEIATINVIKVSELEGMDEIKLQESITKTQAEVTALHQALDANASLKERFEAEGIVTTDIIAVEVKDDGSLDVFVNS